MKIIIPMSGQGKRFFEAGYTTYKPFLPLGDKTMIEAVVDNLKIRNAEFHFVTREEFRHKMPELKGTVHYLPKLTQGAVDTVLSVQELLQTDEELIIANSDQIVDVSMKDFIETARKFDGCLMTFPNDNPKWSYAKEINGFVTEVAEKEVISNHATVGIYYFKRGHEFLKAANRMIEDNFRVNGEFYVCPVYNWYPRHKKIGIQEINRDQMHGLGTPDDYEAYARGVR